MKKIVKLFFIFLYCFIILYLFACNQSMLKNVKTIKDYNNNTLIDSMETVKFGIYPQDDIISNSKEPIEWIILDKKEDKVLLLCKYIIDCQKFSFSNENVTWENSTLRSWLNNYFYYFAFSDDEQKLILDTNIENDGNKKWGIVGEPNTNDKVFCLSISEVERYFNHNGVYERCSNKKIATRGTKYAKNKDKLLIQNEKLDDVVDDYYIGNSYFWLRTRGGECDRVALIGPDGDFYTMGSIVNSESIGVRPAIWIAY